MRYLGIAALAATFWLTVATLRLMIHGPYHQASPPMAAQSPDPTPRVARIEPAPPPVRTCPARVGRAAFEYAASLNPITRGIAELRPELCECWEQHPVRGKARFHLVIAKSGRVSSAAVEGPFARTPLGACLAAAARTARFPRGNAPTATEFAYVMQ